MKELHPLRKFLMRKNQSVEDFAKENGINESTIYLWFRGESFPNQENLAKVRDAMNYEDPITLYKEWKEWQSEHNEG